MASRKGKATAVASDDDDAATAPIGGREAQSRAGVLRQLRPDAQEHQVAASKAAAAKRSAGAMSKEERQAKRARHMKEVRERQRVQRHTCSPWRRAARVASGYRSYQRLAALRRDGTPRRA